MWSHISASNDSKLSVHDMSSRAALRVCHLQLLGPSTEAELVSIGKNLGKQRVDSSDDVTLRRDRLIGGPLHRRVLRAGGTVNTDWRVGRARPIEKGGQYVSCTSVTPPNATNSVGHVSIGESTGEHTSRD